MRRALLAALAVATLSGGGIAVANPPDEDPTCERGTQSGNECAGDNGGDGCDGIRRADPFTPEEADDALDLVTDILGEGNESACDEGS